MQSTLTSRQTDPHDIFVIEPDVVLAARADQTTSDLAHDILSRSSVPQMPKTSAGAASPSVDTTFRAADVSDIRLESGRPPAGKWARRMVMALFAICSAATAAAWPLYGDAAKQMVADLVPPFLLTSSPSPEQPTAAEPSGSPAIQASATDQPAAQAAPVAQSAPPAVAAPPQESTPLVQSMSRDLASMGQQIEQLKASIEQLKAGQEQMAREMAKASEIKNSEIRNTAARTSAARMTEPNPRPRISNMSPPPPRVAAVPARMPRPAFSPAPTGAAPTLPQAVPALVPLQPEPPLQATIQPDGEPVVRPPMPLH